MIDPSLAVKLGFDPWELPLHEVPNFYVTVVSFGGGLNSTALLVMWVITGMPPPHLILFADTGGERPEVYAHIETFSAWLVSRGFPPITMTKKGGIQETLEQYALRTKHLPSMAYGRKGCSHKFKIEPQERDVNRFAPAKAAWGAGSKVMKIIGYGAEEQTRIGRAKIEDDKYFYRFPLDEWGMDRDLCAGVIAGSGLPVPGKSSCFFCPSSTKPEILALPDDLKRRAINIEVVAAKAGNMKTTKGLGRRFNWGEFLAGKEVGEPIKEACMYRIDGPSA